MRKKKAFILYIIIVKDILQMICYAKLFLDLSVILGLSVSDPLFRWPS